MRLRQPGALQAVAVGCAGLLTLSACSTDTDEPKAVTTVTKTITGHVGTPTSSGKKAANCSAPVVALDPGHNGETVAAFDAATGIAMRDYPNGAEDADVLAVARSAKRDLEGAGYKVILLKERVTDSVSYRERVDKAEKVGADIGVSIHTYTDDHRVFDQRVGAFRAGVGADGRQVKVTFTNAATAAKSGTISAAFAAARSKVEGRTVTVTENSSDGRAPLWSGNIPVIALLSDKIPWVYNEFGTPTGGGANPIGEEARKTYSSSIVAGTKAALPIVCR